MARPSRKAVLASLDRAISDLNAVGGLPLPVEAEGIWESIWHEETHHSTAIEGNTLVLRAVTELLNKRRTVGNKSLDEYLEISGYADAAKWVYEQAVRRLYPGAHEPSITLTDVRRIHELVVAPVWTVFPPDDLDPGEGPGGFRRKEVEPLASGFQPITFPLIPAQLDTWIGEASQAPPDGVHFIENLARLHAAFERIHPFRDGNGRAGRLTLNLLLVRHGCPPAIILRRDRERYIRGLERADEGDAGPLSELLARAVRHSIERFLLPALAGPQRLIPLASLADDELSHAALLSAAKRERLRAVRFTDQWYSHRQWVDDYKASRRQGQRPVPEEKPVESTLGLF